MTLAAWVFVAAPAWAAPIGEPAWVEAKVADASDRAYESSAIWLIDGAQRSVVLSLYLLRDSDDLRHPVSRLIQDLVEARQRGVEVTVYLNTKFYDEEPQVSLQTPGLRRLADAGVRLVARPAQRLFHEKLLIVDERYILEGSSNWTVGALRVNGESNTLMDAPALARTKLVRLQAWSQPWDAPQHPQARSPAIPIAIPTAWLARDGALTQLVAGQDDRAFKTLLLLVWEAAGQGTSEFFIELEGLGRDLGMPAVWDASTTRRQVIKVLRTLTDEAHALDVRFAFGRDAWVTLRVPPGPTVDVPPAMVSGPTFQRESAVDTYLRLVRAQLAANGVPFDSLTIRDLAVRTGLHRHRLQQARARVLRDRYTGTPPGVGPAAGLDEGEGRGL